MTYGVDPRLRRAPAHPAVGAPQGLRTQFVGPFDSTWPMTWPYWNWLDNSVTTTDGRYFPGYDQWYATHQPMVPNVYPTGSWIPSYERFDQRNVVSLTPTTYTSRAQQIAAASGPPGAGFTCAQYMPRPPCGYPPEPIPRPEAPPPTPWQPPRPTPYQPPRPQPPQTRPGTLAAPARPPGAAAPRSPNPGVWRAEGVCRPGERVCGIVEQGPVLCCRDAARRPNPVDQGNFCIDACYRYANKREVLYGQDFDAAVDECMDRCTSLTWPSQPSLPDTSGPHLSDAQVVARYEERTRAAIASVRHSPGLSPNKVAAMVRRGAPVERFRGTARIWAMRAAGLPVTIADLRAAIGAQDQANRAPTRRAQVVQSARRRRRGRGRGRAQNPLGTLAMIKLALGHAAGGVAAHAVTRPTRKYHLHHRAAPTAGRKRRRR